jgi:signal transduction histidine kinase
MASARAQAPGLLLPPDPRRALLDQISWFNRLRFGVVVAMFALTFAASRVLGVIEDPVPLFTLATMTLVVNLCYSAWFRRLTASNTTAIRRHVDVQIGIDILILTMSLHFSGGVTNPLVLFYGFHTFITALLRSARAALLVAVASLVLISGLGFGEYYGLLPHHRLRIGLLDFERAGVLGLATWLATLAILLGVSVYFLATILERLRASERELVDLSRQLALSEKLASIGTLAAGVAHEINNPVGVIANKAEILRYRIADADPPELLLGELDTIEKHVGRVRAITEGLLAFSRETPFELRPVAVNELAREAVELVRVPFDSSGVHLELDLDPSSPRVAGSPNHLLQVLVNVLLNARDASPPESAVSVSTRAEGGEVRVRIEDRGVGIAADHLDKIFDPFFTTKEVDRGTGLGLALSHGLIERHRGRIEVHSELGHGAVFIVTLPRLDS